MKIYTNKHGAKYTTKIKYIIRQITFDGLVKLVQDSWGDNLHSEYKEFDTQKEAIEYIGHHEIHNAVILTRVDIDYNPEID